MSLSKVSGIFCTGAFDLSKIALVANFILGVLNSDIAKPLTMLRFLTALKYTLTEFGVSPFLYKYAT